MMTDYDDSMNESFPPEFSKHSPHDHPATDSSIKFQRPDSEPGEVPHKSGSTYAHHPEQEPKGCGTETGHIIPVYTAFSIKNEMKPHGFTAVVDRNAPSLLQNFRVGASPGSSAFFSWGGIRRSHILIRSFFEFTLVVSWRRRMKERLGLEAMHEYIEKYLSLINESNPRFHLAVKKALSVKCVEKIYEDTMKRETTW